MSTEKVLEAALAWWADMGVDIPEVKSTQPAPKRPRPVKKPQPLTSRPQSPTPSPQTTPSLPTAEVTAPLATAAKTLAELKAVMADFDGGALTDGARQCVFSRGNPNADIMIIGEAPGRDEDLKGQPFVGRSGQLLDKMFAAIGLSEQEFYITNVINWRPPNNRAPKPEEIDMCRPFLHKHITLIDPKVIVIVGGVSLTAMTGLTGIMKTRGQWQSLTIGALEIPALPIYHPAFLLRQPALKKDAWRDMLSLKERLETL